MMAIIHDSQLQKNDHYRSTVYIYAEPTFKILILATPVLTSC